MIAAIWRGFLLRSVVVALLWLPGIAQAAGDDSSPPGITGQEISILIRTTIVALDQANVTGNYSVLRDLGADELWVNTSAAQLSEMFKAFRDQAIDLAPTVLLDPKLSDRPQLTEDGVLHLAGYFATRPQEVIFDMTFRYERSHWRVASLNVGSRAPTASP